MTNVLIEKFNNHNYKIPDKIKEQLDKLLPLVIVFLKNK